MGWLDESGAHEGFLLPEFGDGTRGLGVTGGTIPPDRIAVAVAMEHPDEPTRTEYLTRAAAEATGWRICCTCATPSTGWTRPGVEWVGDLLVRVPSASLENLGSGQIFATDDEVPYVGDRDDVYQEARDRWSRLHATPAATLSAITDAQQRAALALASLDAAVSEARRRGCSWQQIGDAAGITRQSAHERWSRH